MGLLHPCAPDSCGIEEHSNSGATAEGPRLSGSQKGGKLAQVGLQALEGWTGSWRVRRPEQDLPGCSLKKEILLVKSGRKLRMAK